MAHKELIKAMSCVLALTRGSGDSRDDDGSGWKASGPTGKINLQKE
jgi:hypothetical protein